MFLLRLIARVKLLCSASSQKIRLQKIHIVYDRYANMATVNNPVLVGKLLQTPREIAIVHHIMAAECCPFRSASRTTGIHDAERVIELLLTLPHCQLLVAHLVAQLQQIAPSIHAWPPVVPQSNDMR